MQQFLAWAALPPNTDMRGWQFVPLDIEGETRAVAAVSGYEIHFAIDPVWRGRVITRSRTRQFLGPIFKAKGFLTTRSQPDEEKARFLRRIGFHKTWSDGNVDHYMMSELPFGKRLPARNAQ